MKGYRTIIDAPFKGGLRSSSVSLRNKGHFTVCRNARIQAEGMEGYSPIISNILDDRFQLHDSITGNHITITWSFPFPQFFLTDVGFFIGAKEGLYKIIAFSPTLTAYSYGTGTVTWPWTFVDIPGYPAFASGSVFVYYDGNAATYCVVT